MTQCEMVLDQTSSGNWIFCAKNAKYLISSPNWCDRNGQIVVKQSCLHCIASMNWLPNTTIWRRNK